MNTESDLCSSDLERVFNSILAGFGPLIGCPLLLYIGVKYLNFHRREDNKNDYPKTTFAFLSTTVVLYVTVSLEIVNFCYDFRTSAAAVLKSTVDALYGAHVDLLIVLLFLRLYHAFETSAYKLSKCSIGCFITLFALGFVVDIIAGARAFGYFFVAKEKCSEVCAILHFIGAVLTVVATLSVILLYIWKLFFVVRARYLSRNDRSFAHVQKEPLIRHCAKYAVLAVASVLTDVCFWSLGHYSSRSFLWFFLLYVSATANVLCYALGFGYADNSYRRMCGCVHVCCQAMCSKLVLVSTQCVGGGDEATMATITGTPATPAAPQTQTATDVDDCREVDLPSVTPTIEINVRSNSNEPGNEGVATTETITGKPETQIQQI